MTEKQMIRRMVRGDFFGSTHVDLLKDIDNANQPGTFHKPDFKLNRSILELTEFTNDALMSRVKTRPPKKPAPFAYVAAVSGDPYVLKSISSFCALHHFQNGSHPMYMAVSNIDPAAREILKLVGVTPIEIGWQQPVHWIRHDTVQSRGPGFPRMFKTNLFGLEEFFEYGLFMDADTFFRRDIEPVVQSHLEQKTEFIANWHNKEHCATTNAMFFKTSLRRLRRMAMRSYTNNANRSCSGDDQMIISAEFEPLNHKYTDFLNKQITNAENHWQGERDQLLSLAKKYGLVQQTKPNACVNYWNKLLTTNLLEPDSFKCRQPGCMAKLAELLRLDH
eukprot:CAMPEP_0185853422 /NCGR_PEP_ID=MMETSP1354-20130828/18954_1 /TAXON_ID=708628 /ORGANISM="Erythrolobus madagascarensis, Strain CCMP3276" /LENGTH=333 /DNA_ID=CAMNT_0028554909 /DNA_START=206 /DNA_END=1207 /DNA_ORIENTATION=-